MKFNFDQFLGQGFVNPDKDKIAAIEKARDIARYHVGRGIDAGSTVEEETTAQGKVEQVQMKYDRGAILSVTVTRDGNTQG